jgi:hypothetical protein
VQGYLYKSSVTTGRYSLALWSILGEPRTLALPSTWSKVTLVNALGQTVTPVSDKRGNRSVTLGLAPLYVTGVADNGALATALAPLQ